jgi:hypothetical protein
MHKGSEEEAPPLEYVVVEENNPQEQQPREGEQVPEQLPVCPNHGPSNFVRGKPQSISMPSPISILSCT